MGSAGRHPDETEFRPLFARAVELLRAGGLVAFAVAAVSVSAASAVATWSTAKPAPRR